MSQDKNPDLGQGQDQGQGQGQGQGQSQGHWDGVESLRCLRVI